MRRNLVSLVRSSLFTLTIELLTDNIKMQKKNLTIVNKLGLHARAAAKLVKLASSFESDIQVKRQQREVNGKSIMGVMMLAASNGTEIEITVSGEDEMVAMEQLTNLIQNKFGEEE